MDIPEKTVFAGSFFELTDSGREKIISDFQDLYGDNVPFVGFDTEHNLFYCKADDPATINLFLSTISNAIQLWISKKGNDLTESPRLRPLPNTTLPTETGPLRTDDLRLPENALIDFDQDSDDSTENTSSAEGGSTTYWEPACGDINLLSQDVAVAIADITDCFISPEPQQKRVILMHGNTQKALEKLKRLQPLLELMHRHQHGPAARIDQNLLSFTSEAPGPGVCFAPVRMSPHIDRVMVHPSVEDCLEKMLIPEERNWSNIEGRYLKAENLDLVNVDATRTFGSSSIWHGFEMPAISNPDNALPKPPSDAGSVASARRAGYTSGSIPIQPSKFLGVTEQVRLKEWSKNIDANADPRLAAEEPVEPNQEAPEEPATQRLVADSDSESEEKEELPKNRRLVEVDSDDDSDQLPVSKSKPVAQLKIVDYGKTRFSREVASQVLADRTNGQGPRIPLRINQQPITSSAHVVSADDFYAGIPRGAPRQEASCNPPQQAPSSLSRRQPEKARRPRHGFGFDGAADNAEDEEDFTESKYQHRTDSLQGQASNARALPLASDSSMCTSHVQFDPARYGVDDRKSQRSNPKPPKSPRYQQNLEDGEWQTARDKKTRNKPHNFDYRQGWNRGQPELSKPTGPMPKATVDWNSGRSSQGRDDQRLKTKLQTGRLIDFDEADNHSLQLTAIMPPPGFDMRTTADVVMQREANILDSPLEQIHRPAIKPASDQQVYSSEDNLFSSASSSGGRRTVFDYTPQTQVNKLDIPHIRSSVLTSLMAEKQKNDRKKGKSQLKQVGERIEEEDELSARKYYNTMNLQAGNPGKGKKQSKRGTHETTADAAVRHAKALEDAYGPAKPASKTASKTASKSAASTTAPAPEQLSPQARQLAKKNSNFAAIHAATLQSDSLNQSFMSLVQRLGPLFDALRAFPAAAVQSHAVYECSEPEIQLEFEMQLGQIMVGQTSMIKEKKVYERQTWEKMFDNPDSSFDVLFTNILTNNGADVDRLLTTKAGGEKVWDKDEPGISKVMLKFKCQDKAGLEFILHVDEKANYHVSKGVAVIGKVGIHCPGRIWDACAILSGTPGWQDIPHDVELAVKDFIDGMHVKQGPITTVFHRLPSSNNLTVHEVLSERTSLHRSLVKGEDGLVLKVTEVKTLCTQTHSKDKRLFKSFEKPDYEQMARERRVHYEVSLTHQGLTQGFHENQNLEIGEATPESSSGRSLTLKYMKPLLKAALRQVEKMDWVGMHNCGSIQHKKDLEAQRAYNLAATMPPTAAPSRYARPIHVPAAGLSIAGPRTIAASRMAPASHYGGPPQPIHGIRMNSQAEIWQDPDGSLYRTGIGNARIPLGDEDPTGIGDRDVLPDDSASQAGDVRRVRPMSGFNDKPANFW